VQVLPQHGESFIDGVLNHEQVGDSITRQDLMDA
jgi:hypothetical protein